MKPCMVSKPCTLKSIELAIKFCRKKEARQFLCSIADAEANKIGFLEHLHFFDHFGIRSVASPHFAAYGPVFSVTLFFQY